MITYNLDSNLMKILPILSVSPLIFLTDTSNTISIIKSLIISFNTIIRIYYPSTYVPSSKYNDNMISSPFLARTIATIAEITFYYEESRFLQINFWNSYFGFLTILAESFSWCCLLFQSHMFSFFEDSTWTIIQLYAFYIQTKKNKKDIFYYICLLFILYMVSTHLINSFKRIKKPYINKYEKTIIRKPNQFDLSWQIPSLLILPLGYSYFLLNKKFSPQ